MECGLIHEALVRNMQAEAVGRYLTTHVRMYVRTHLVTDMLSMDKIGSAAWTVQDGE